MDRSLRLDGAMPRFCQAGVLLALLLGRAVQGQPPGVSLHGTEYTKEDIDSGVVEIESGSFIVGTDKASKETLLRDLEDQLGWKPKKRMSERMPMFAGKLNQAQILWLLQRPDVKYIENDGEVRALVKGGKK